MGTTADKLNGVIASKEAIRQAIIAKGVEVPTSTKLSEYGAKIGLIEQGGGGGASATFYEDLCKSLAGTVDFGTSTLCVISVCKCGSKGETYGIDNLMTMSDKIVFSDGTTLPSGSQEWRMTNLLENDGEHYYWAMDYLTDIDGISLMASTVAVAFVSNGYSGTLSSSTFNKVKYLQYMDFGGVTFSGAKFAAMTTTKCPASLTNVANYKLTSTDGTGIDLGDSLTLKHFSLAEASNGVITTEIDIAGVPMLAGEDITAFFNMLGEGDGFSSYVSFYYLTSEQKSILDNKGFAY